MKEHKVKNCSNCGSNKIYVSKSIIQDGCFDTIYRCWDCDNPHYIRTPCDINDEAEVYANE